MAIDASREGCAELDGELIEREMFDRKSERPCELAAPRRFRNSGA